MAWFKNKPYKSTQRLTPSVVRFVGEQDGSSERDLKGRLIELFRLEVIVERAYLARAEHNDVSGVHVTLCLKCSTGKDPSILPKVAAIFGSMFGSHEHLDIRFLKEGEERELRSVCIPFYPSKPTSWG
jgi:hypothetical protein